MSKDLFDLDPEESSGFRELLQAGSDIAGAAAGGALGFVTASLPGAVIGAGSGPLITRGLMRLGLEMRRGVLGPRELQRTGAVLALALQKTQENLDRGKTENQSFMGVQGRPGSASEVYEALVLAVQRTLQRRRQSCMQTYWVTSRLRRRWTQVRLINSLALLETSRTDSCAYWRFLQVRMCSA